MPAVNALDSKYSERPGADNHYERDEHTARCVIRSGVHAEQDSAEGHDQSDEHNGDLFKHDDLRKDNKYFVLKSKRAAVLRKGGSARVGPSSCWLVDVGHGVLERCIPTRFSQHQLRSLPIWYPGVECRSFRRSCARGGRS